MNRGTLHRAGLLILVCFGTTACAGLDREQEVTLWETQLIAEPAHPELTGQAAAVSGPTGTDLGIGIVGAEPGAVHRWRARLGTCTAPGEQIGPSSDYPALEVDASGTAGAETHLGPRLRRDGTYQVEVHESASDTTRIACGDLVAR